MAGQRKGKRSTGDLVKIGAAVVVVGLIGVSTLVHFQGQKKEAADIAVAWTVTGRACPTLPAGATPPNLPRQLEHEGVAYARERGPVSCNAIRANGEGEPVPVCMFANPGVLRVKTVKATVTYAPAGEPATVYVRDGAPSCVLHINRAVAQ